MISVSIWRLAGVAATPAMATSACRQIRFPSPTRADASRKPSDLFVPSDRTGIGPVPDQDRSIGREKTRKTADSRQQTADSRQQTADSKAHQSCKARKSCKTRLSQHWPRTRHPHATVRRTLPLYLSGLHAAACTPLAIGIPSRNKIPVVHFRPGLPSTGAWWELVSNDCCCSLLLIFGAYLLSSPQAWPVLTVSTGAVG